MVLTRSMATTNDVQNDEPPRPITLERQVQTLAAAVERLMKQNHDLEEQLDRGTRDITSRRKTRGIAPKEGGLRSKRVVMSPVERKGRI